MKAALRGGKTASALSEKKGNNKVTDEASAFIILALGDNPLQAVQSCIPLTMLGRLSSLHILERPS